MRTFLIALIMLLSLAACAPNAVPATTPIPPPVPLASSFMPTPVQTAEEIAWQKVVSDAKKEGNVTLYAWAFTGDIGIEIARLFKEKYGITVEIITGRGNEQIERLKTEQRIGNVVADVMESSTLNVLNAKTAGVVVSPGELPVLKEKNVWLMPPGLDPEGTAFAYIASPILVWANTNMKPEDEPKAWKDLLAPKWKGKMVCPTRWSAAVLIWLLCPCSTARL